MSVVPILICQQSGTEDQNHRPTEFSHFFQLPWRALSTHRTEASQQSIASIIDQSRAGCRPPIFNASKTEPIDHPTTLPGSSRTEQPAPGKIEFCNGRSLWLSSCRHRRQGRGERQGGAANAVRHEGCWPWKDGHYPDRSGRRGKRDNDRPALLRQLARAFARRAEFNGVALCCGDAVAINDHCLARRLSRLQYRGQPRKCKIRRNQ